MKYLIEPKLIDYFVKNNKGYPDPLEDQRKRLDELCISNYGALPEVYCCESGCLSYFRWMFSKLHYQNKYITWVDQNYIILNRLLLNKQK